MDFANNNGRAVIITGLPYPPRMDPKVCLLSIYTTAYSQVGRSLSLSLSLSLQVDLKMKHLEESRSTRSVKVNNDVMYPDVIMCIMWKMEPVHIDGPWVCF